MSVDAQVHVSALTATAAAPSARRGVRRSGRSIEELHAEAPSAVIVSDASSALRWNVKGVSVAGASAMVTSALAPPSAVHASTSCSIGASATGSRSVNVADAYGGAAVPRLPTGESSTAEANTDSTRRSCRAGSANIGNEQPAEDAPHERGAGVRDGVGDAVLVAVSEDRALCVAEGEGCASLEGEAADEGPAEADGRLLAVPHGDCAAFPVRVSDGVVDA